MKKILSVMLAILMMASLTACQTVEDFKGGLAHITGTETEPPSAFTPTVTPEAEPAPETDTKPTVIMQEVPMATVEDDGADENGECVSCGDQNSAFETQATGKSNIDPARFPTDLKATMKEYSKVSDWPYSSLSKENFKYALLVQDGDFSRKNSDVFDELYMYPYNLYSFNSDTQEGNKAPDSIEDADYGFKTNTECLNLYGEDILIKCINLARKYERANNSCDYTDPAKNKAWAQEWAEATLCFAGTNVVAGAINTAAKEGEYIVNADFASDIGLVYQDAEGNLRVRGTSVSIYEHMSDKLLDNGKHTSGEWAFIDKEIIIHVENGRFAVSGEVSMSNCYCPAIEENKALLTALFESMPAES